jgi:hypothetical protein
MSLLTAPKRQVLARFGRTADCSGCYVLLEKGDPFYVGISRKVASRLSQHVKGKTHFDASLAYAMACRCCEHSMRRAATASNCFRPTAAGGTYLAAGPTPEAAQCVARHSNG